MALSVSGAISLLVRTPTALFPIALGLAGLGSALWIAAETLSVALARTIGTGVLISAAIVLTIDIVLYLAKFIRDREAVRDDLSVATTANLLAPGFMAAMVLGSAWHALSPVGGAIWMVASAGHLLLLFRFVGRWLVHEFSPEDLNPTWFLPAAGIMTAALTWPNIGPVEWPLLLLAIGAILWMMLLPLIFEDLSLNLLFNQVCVRPFLSSRHHSGYWQEDCKHYCLKFRLSFHLGFSQAQGFCCLSSSPNLGFSSEQA